MQDNVYDTVIVGSGPTFAKASVGESAGLISLNFNDD